MHDDTFAKLTYVCISILVGLKNLIYSPKLQNIILLSTYRMLVIYVFL